MAVGAVSVPSKTWVPPVGMILTTGSPTSPAELYPGTTWARIKDRFLWGASETHPLGETGGSATHTLTVNEMPAHTHSASLYEAGVHTHTISILDGSSMNFGSSSYQNAYLSGSKKVTTSSAGAHTHTVTLSATGSSKAFNIMNPYAAKNVWRRVS